MLHKIFPLLFFSVFFVKSPTTSHKEPKLAANTVVKTVSKSEQIYTGLKSNNFSLPQLESFKYAYEGFVALKEKGLVKKNILTLIDFSQSANSKRLWVIDMESQTVLFHTLVAHGRNTGEEFATNFSNVAESFKSSLGFYATAEVYQGKHGVSLRLDGLEKGINDNARNRAVVMHGADYVSEKFIQQNKRLGRSLGCPAVPVELSAEIIETIKDKSCLFIYHPTRNYVAKSKLVS
jgi:hypothetical protein